MKRILFLIIGFLFPLPVLAQPALLPACAESGNCGFCDIADVIGRGFEFLLYFLGAVIFFVFMWGAFNMISSRGRSEKLETGKETMKGALFGALLVLVAWHVINLMVYMLITPIKDPLAPVKGKGEKGGLLFGNPWNWLCDTGSMTNVPEAQKACFSRGDGTPCTTGTVNGICMEGECGTKYPNTCEYLKAKYPDEFSSYNCESQTNVDKFNKTAREAKREAEQNGNPQYNTEFYDCLPDPSFCGLGNTVNFCCGTIKEGGNPYNPRKYNAPIIDSVPAGSEANS